MYAVKTTRPILVASLWIISLIFVLACGGDNGDEQPTATSAVPTGANTTEPAPLKAELPILKTGDTWTFRVLSEGIEYASILTITGENATDSEAVYPADWSINPPRDGVSKYALDIDRATMAEVRMQGTGSIDGSSFTVAVTYSDAFSDMPFPLSVGKIWEEKRTISTVTTETGEPQESRETKDYVVKVSRLENVTVPAGTFECYEILRYDNNNVLQRTSWYSDKVKQAVKEIDGDNDEIRELVSYSLVR